MNSKYITVALCFSLIYGFSGCKKFVDIEPPKTKLLTSEAFKTDEGATSAVLGIYNMMSTTDNSITNGAMSFYPGLSSDDLNKFRLGKEDQQFYTNELVSNSSIIAGMWGRSYEILGQVNTCIEELQKSVTLTEKVKVQLLAEARISRALIYFYLVNIWGDVPLVLNTNWKQNMLLKRSAENIVYEQIIADLKRASVTISTDYITEEKVRPNKYAALALLARVYLYRKDWSNAEEMADQVINSKVYSLVKNTDEAFLKNNAEAIWQLMPVTGSTTNTNEGNIFIPYSDETPPNYMLTEDLLQSFEPGDQRKTSWIKSVDYLGSSYYYPYKYKVRSNSGSNNTTLKEYYTVLRLAETYLVRSEARAQNNHTQDAVKDLNVLRERARALPTVQVPDPLPELSVNLSKEDVLLAIEHERRTELFAEWGHRWFDLKRTGRANAVLKVLKPTWTVNAQLYPIPRDERRLNSELTQNPGYN